MHVTTGGFSFIGGSSSLSRWVLGVVVVSKRTAKMAGKAAFECLLVPDAY